MKRLSIILAVSLLLTLSACGNKTEVNSGTEVKNVSSADPVSTDISTDNMDFEFTNNDTDYSVDEARAVTVKESEDLVKITKEGTYIVTGKHSGITVDAPDTAKIKIVLKNAEIISSDGPAIYIKEADKVFLTAYKDTLNKVSDGTAYSSDYTSVNADGAIFSKADLTVNGEGTLKVSGNYKCSIVSKDDLVICGLTLTVDSVGCAIEGKDCIKASGAKITVNAGGDGIKSTNSEDTNRGFVYIENGSYNITAQNDGIQAETVLKISDGDFNIKTGGGSTNASTDKGGGWGMWGGSTSTEAADSAKALKATSRITVNGGKFNIDSSDDSVHSNSDAEINAGSLDISSGDDGIHADDELIINGGTISVKKSYEGLEATGIKITGGTIDVTASDDGLNAAGGNDSSAMGGRPGENSFNSNSKATISISGGYVLVNAEGDGIDSNGSVTVSGGVVLVSGPTNSGNGAFDYDSTAEITGGTAILCGSSGMAQGFSDSSSQPSFLYNLDSSVSAGTGIAVTDSDGNVIASFLPSKQYNCIVISTPGLKVGETYNLLIGGGVSGSDKNGYASSGQVSDAQNSYEIELSSVSVSYGSNAGGGHGFGGNMGGAGGGPKQMR